MDDTTHTAAGDAFSRDGLPQDGLPQDGLPQEVFRMTPGLRLAKIALAHLFVAVLALSLFAAADAWRAVSGLGIATLLGVVTGGLAGVTLVTLIHEWFHFLGARSVHASYRIPDKLGLFVYDWDFAANDLRQFLRMSVAGSVGGAVAIGLLWWSVPLDTSGRAALLGGAIAGFVFAACVEWPVLRRVRHSGDPMAELGKIDPTVLSRSFIAALAAGSLFTLLAAP